MTRKIYIAWAIGLALPIAALADASGAMTVPVNTNFSLDTGTTGSSGGDIRFTGAEIQVVGKATIGAAGHGVANYDGDANAFSINFLLQQFGGKFPTSPIFALIAGAYFDLQTNGGNLGTFIILSVSATTLQIQWYTAGASATGSTPLPAISSISNAGSYQGNALAQGSLFVVKGSNLSASGFVQTSFPLPTSNGGVSITFWPQDGSLTSTNAYLVYLYNQNGVNQLAGIVPSTLSPGNYLAIATNNTLISQFVPVTVVAAQPGLITQDSSGFGLVVAQNYISASELDIDRFTTGTVNGSTISPAHPGQTLIVWLTGLGPIPSPDNVGTTAYNFEANGALVEVYVGGMAITPSYAGRAPGLAAVDQINFTLPGNVPTGCEVGFQVSENGVLSQETFISIAPSAGTAACVQGGLTTSQLQSLDSGGTIAIGQASVVSDAVTAQFAEYTGFELPGPLLAPATQTPGCTVYQSPYSPAPGATISYLGVPFDAGKLTVTGPSGSGLLNVTLPESNDNYALYFAGQLATISGQMLPGAYTLAGAGGKDIGQFSTTLTLPTLLTVSNFPSVVNRSSGLTLNWTGGNPADPVQINGQALTNANGVLTGMGFACNTTAGAGTYTIPSSILNQLPAVSPSATPTSTSPHGTLSVSWSTAPSGSNGTFSAPLTAGGAVNTTFTGSTNINMTVAYQ